MLAQFVPTMVERGSERIRNGLSIAAFQPVPPLATDAATKAYVLSLTESLAGESASTPPSAQPPTATAALALQWPLEARFSAVERSATKFRPE